MEALVARSSVLRPSSPRESETARELLALESVASLVRTDLPIALGSHHEIDHSKDFQNLYEMVVSKHIPAQGDELRAMAASFISRRPIKGSSRGPIDRRRRA